jgi:hypothetical protein
MRGHQTNAAEQAARPDSRFVQSPPPQMSRNPLTTFPPARTEVLGVTLTLVQTSKEASVFGLVGYQLVFCLAGWLC